MSLKLNSYISKKQYLEICPKEVVIHLKRVSLSKEVEVSLYTNNTAATGLNTKLKQSEMQEQDEKLDQIELNPLDLSLNPESEREDEFISGEMTLLEEICEEIPIEKIKEEFPDSYVGHEMLLFMDGEQMVEASYEMLLQDCPLKQEDFGGITPKEEVSDEFFEDASLLAGVHRERLNARNENTAAKITSELLQQDSNQEKEKCPSSSNKKVIPKFIDISKLQSKSLSYEKRWSSELCARAETVRKPIENSSFTYLSTQSSLLSHLTTNKEKHFKCSFCPYQAGRKEHMVAHIRTHSGEKPFKCNLCPYRAVTKGHVTRHSLIHTGEKPFKCSFCPYQSAFKSNFKLHTQTHFGEKPFKCSTCPYQAARRSDIERHLTTHTGMRPFKCNLCSYQAATKGDINRHSLVHTGEKPFKCNSCPYRAATKGTMNRHLRTHSGEKRYKCGSCSYRAITKSHIQRHLRTHTGEKPFKCSLCSYQSSIKENVTRHSQTHSGEKPFKCKYCPYQSETKGAIKRHSRFH